MYGPWKIKLEVLSIGGAELKTTQRELILTKDEKERITDRANELNDMNVRLDNSLKSARAGRPFHIPTLGS